MSIALGKSNRKYIRHSLYPISQIVLSDKCSYFLQVWILNLSLTPSLRHSFVRNEKNTTNVKMQTLEKNQMMDLSKGNKPIECKWAFTIKYKVD